MPKETTQKSFESKSANIKKGFAYSRYFIQQPIPNCIKVSMTLHAFQDTNVLESTEKRTNNLNCSFGAVTEEEVVQIIANFANKKLMEFRLLENC